MKLLHHISQKYEMYTSEPAGCAVRTNTMKYPSHLLKHDDDKCLIYPCRVSTCKDDPDDGEHQQPGHQLTERSTTTSTSFNV